MPHTTFSLQCHFQQCPWDLGCALAERVGQWGGGCLLFHKWV